MTVRVSSSRSPLPQGSKDGGALMTERARSGAKKRERQGDPGDLQVSVKSRERKISDSRGTEACERPDREAAEGQHCQPERPAIPEVLLQELEALPERRRSFVRVVLVRNRLEPDEVMDRLAESVSQHAVGPE